MNGVPPLIKLPLSKTQKGLHLTSEEKYLYDKSRTEFLKLWKPDLTILCVRWEYVSEADTTDLLNLLEKYSSRTLLMEQPPELAMIGNRNALQYMIFRGIKPRAIERQTSEIPARSRSNADSSQPQTFRLPRMLPFIEVSCCKIVSASLRKTEVISGPFPLRIRLESSVKVTSRI